MRNILVHIELSKLRDNFIFEAKERKVDEERLSVYMEKLDEIQNENIKYWESSILKLK